MTPPTTSPTTHHRLRLLVRAFGVIAFAGSTMFALWPLHPKLAQLPSLDPPTHEKSFAPALDLAAFRVPLWVAEPTPPPPPAQPAPATPPPPLKLQLLAIVKEGELYKAAIYDPDSDKLLVVAAGESIGSRTVNSVSSSGITIKDGQTVRTLALDAEGKGAPP